MVAKALATESGVNFISVKGPEIMSKYVGESERAVREIFKKARMAAPCILFLDEIDSLVPTRGSAGGDSQVTERVISQFLTELGGIERLKGVVVIGATNRLDMVDSAISRAGRFDIHLNFPLPDKNTRLRIFKIHTKEKPLDKDVNLEKLADQTEEYSGADIEAVCRRASMLAIRGYIENKKAKIENQKLELKISKSNFEEAVSLLKKQENEMKGGG